MLSLLRSDNKTGVTPLPFAIGFITNARAFIKQGTYLLTNHPLVKIQSGYKLSQGHIGTLFSKIRSSSWFNNSPDVVRFMAALKRLLVEHEITLFSMANCLDLNAYSRSPPILQ